ncbi:hypothetical protein [Prochlorococcus marinus]|uniref:Uncharacterized protein n=1 Tax=Prochlorococcus marinus (strain MIT 9211) TaxID=93059 RepID=A9BAH4_PROM4|nr:hypothetical protein [Prochlorococcus marinus]ABX08836.1 Hypothetical protein P9211_09051 [Prochlorococcus marinus str. MIT 9211]
MVKINYKNPSTLLIYFTCSYILGISTIEIYRYTQFSWNDYLPYGLLLDILVIVPALFIIAYLNYWKEQWRLVTYSQIKIIDCNSYIKRKNYTIYLVSSTLAYFILFINNLFIFLYSLGIEGNSLKTYLDYSRNNIPKLDLLIGLYILISALLVNKFTSKILSFVSGLTFSIAYLNYWRYLQGGHSQNQVVIEVDNLISHCILPLTVILVFILLNIVHALMRYLLDGESISDWTCPKFKEKFILHLYRLTPLIGSIFFYFWGTF